MAVNYAKTSPWYDTKKKPGYLDHLSIRAVSSEPDDILYTIEPQFNYRPDLLSTYLYDTPKLWWVFSQRNLDVIRDPVFDFKTGTQIFVPKKPSLFKVLGI
jgi:hypothetical protein